MQLKIQKRLAADILKAGESRIWLDNSRLDEIKEAITKADVRSLIKDKAIRALPVKSVSRVRARKITIQKSKGRRKGKGSRKGKRTARLPKKISWIRSIRPQRKLLKDLRDKTFISKTTYQKIYRRAKSGFFRSRRHIKMYLEEHNLIKK